MILACQSICKSFGEKEILKDASFHIEEREKAALIGNNGAGKTTLLRIIMEEISSDSGNVVLAKDKRWDIWPSIRTFMVTALFMKNFLPPNSISSTWKNECVPWSRK